MNVAPPVLVNDGDTRARVRTSVSVAELLAGSGSVIAAGALTVAVFDRLPVAAAEMVALAV